jgi:hypothetical protein
MKLIYYQPTDQPTTCPICGARTDYVDLSDLIQSHVCLSKLCEYSFMLEFDDENKEEDSNS